MFKILLFLLLIPNTPQETDYALAKTMSGLSDRQKTVLYQYGTLHTYGDTTAANTYWNKHSAELNQLSKEQANILSADLLLNTELVYRSKAPSRLQSLMGIFTAAHLLTGAAALIALCALLLLLKRFWYKIYHFAMQYLAPVFRLLFSPKILKFQLLLLSLTALLLGPGIEDLMFRTLTLQFGLVLLWTQLTSLTTNSSFYKLYRGIFRSHHRDLNVKEVLLQITMPCAVTVLATGWLLYASKDSWYSFEITVFALVTLYSFPPINWLLPALGKIFLPFPTIGWKKDTALAGYIVLTMILWLGLLFIPVIPISPLTTLTLVLTFLLLYFSIAEFFSAKSDYKNYLWVQFSTLLYFCASVLAGSTLGITLITWSGLAGIFLYVLIKYWELPTLFGWSWEHRKTLGILGMALLIWGIAQFMIFFPEFFLISY